MSFTLYCLICKKDSEISINYLEKSLAEYFSEDDEFSMEIEEDPFDAGENNLLLSWGDWWIRVFYEVGEDIKEDSQEMAKYAESPFGDAVASLDRRVRVLFEDDDDMQYTNHTIIMIDFLEQRDDLVIFDPLNNKFIKGYDLTE
ncbi:MAG: hypothetical protein ACTHOH_16720 [Lysobacteraceae bacterium]